jgi:2-dehydro-3-deoxygalactonokinase
VTDLIALDWGTSSLRVARLRADGTVLDEHASATASCTCRPAAFPAVFARATSRWQLAPGTLCLASGMVGSRQGWIEAPYCPCPSGFRRPGAPHRLGARCARRRAAGHRGRPVVHKDGVPDVMRGEEVQVMGALALLDRTDGLFVLPGTHSKWARVEAGRITGFATFMTGEVYALLRQHSILARTLPADDGPLDEAGLPARRRACARQRQPAARGLQRPHAGAVRRAAPGRAAQLPVGPAGRRRTARASLPAGRPWC